MPVFIPGHLKYCSLRNTGEQAKAGLTQYCLLCATSEPDAVRCDTSEGELGRNSALKRKEKKKEGGVKGRMM